MLDKFIGSWINGQPIVKTGIDDKGRAYVENSLGEKFYECESCGNFVREGNSTVSDGYICCNCN
jgi:hypothetical protein